VSVLPKPTLSATIVGKRTNRLKVNKPKPTSSGNARRRYAKDPEVRAMDVVTLCISMPVVELVELDAMCERTQMARSHFLRQAVKHFTAKVKP
jgi:hypothetical protein